MRPNEASAITLLYLHYRKFSDPFTLVDVGANTGSYCLLPIAIPNARSFCFEVHPLAFSLLSQAIELNVGLASRVIPVNAAVGDVAGCCGVPPESFRLGLTTVKCLSGGSRSCGESGTETMRRMVTLDDWLLADGRLSAASAVRLIKIDAEGWDLRVLEGAKALIHAHKPDLLTESDSAIEIQWLRALGYQKVDWFRTGHMVTLLSADPELHTPSPAAGSA